jgi:hypothetical protein
MKRVGCTAQSRSLVRKHGRDGYPRLPFDASLRAWLEVRGLAAALAGGRCV